MSWLDSLKEYVKNKNDSNVRSGIDREAYFNEMEYSAATRRQEELFSRSASVVNAKTNAKVLNTQETENQRDANYLVHTSYLIKQGSFFYVEEKIEQRKARFVNDKLVHDDLNEPQRENIELPPMGRNSLLERGQRGFKYKRLEAVKYAESWWNSHNPAYKSFDVDCTNYVSQCLHAGGAPMRGYPERTKGWWMQNNNWSFSWSVANALRWYLSGSKQGLRGEEVSSASQLVPGDVICYDFEGDDKWDHTTIVVEKDDQGMPLVNAHTTNSRMRYWEYKDSTAWTSKIKYKFFRIVDE